MEEAWIGKYSAHVSKDRSWPSYNRPPASSWKTWQKWVTKALLSRGRHLKHPLGSWLFWDDLWQWYASREGQLYSLLDGIWYSHKQISKRNGRPLFEKDAQVCDPPLQPLRTTVYFKGDRIVVTGSDVINVAPMFRPHSFKEYMSNLSELAWCTYSLEAACDGKKLVKALITGTSATGMAVSDGSYKDTYGTAAWTIGTEDEENLLSGRAVCPGDPEDQSSYRSELTGLYAILAITHQLCEYYNVEEGYIEIGCDGQSALQTALEHEPFLSKDLPDYDLIGAIYSLRKSSRISWSFKHEKGHQDDHSTELDT